VTHRVIASWYKLARFEPGTGVPIDVGVPHNVTSTISPEHRATIFQGAVEGIVLVKNVNQALPLRKPAILSLFGYDAQAPAKNTPEGALTKYQFGLQSVNITDMEMQALLSGVLESPAAARLGTLISGSGSPSVVPAYINSPHDAFQQRAMEDGTYLLWDYQSQDPVYANAASDACIVFINEFAVEGVDRSTLADAWSDELVLNVASKCPNVGSHCFQAPALVILIIAAYRPLYLSTTLAPGWWTDGLITLISQLSSWPISQVKIPAVR
jgi:beta-glucosidase